MKSVLFLLLTLSTCCFCFNPFNYGRNLLKRGVSDVSNLKDSLTEEGDDVKCFNLASFGSFAGSAETAISRVASKVLQDKKLDMKFTSVSTANATRHEVLVEDQPNLTDDDLVPKDMTAIIVHGFMSAGDVVWVQEMADAFLNWARKNSRTANVIAADWSDGGFTPNYATAAMNTKTAGLQIASMIERFANESRVKNNGQSSLGKIHCIGHSLGSHVCSVAANQLKSQSEEIRIQRITVNLTVEVFDSGSKGLDPARPCFSNETGKSLKLDQFDAPFVDVIHTNVGRFGKLKPLGHIDFYPNGGRNQPDCGNAVTSLISNLKYTSKVVRLSSKDVCEHSRSYQYFTASLNGKCTYTGQRCAVDLKKEECVVGGQSDDVPEMGMNSIEYQKSHGSYFVQIPNKQWASSSDKSKCLTPAAA